MPSDSSPRPWPRDSDSRYLAAVEGDPPDSATRSSRGHARLPGLAAMLPGKPSSPRLQQQQQQSQHSQPSHQFHHHHHQHQQYHHQQHQHQRHNPQHHQHPVTSSPAPRPLSPPFSATAAATPSTIPRPPLLATAPQQPSRPHSPTSIPTHGPPATSPASTSPTSALNTAPVATSAAPLPVAPRTVGAKRPAAADLQRSVSTAPPLKRPATTSTIPLPAAGGGTKRSGSPSPAPAPSYHDYPRQMPPTSANIPTTVPTSANTAAISVLPVPSAAMMHQPLTADQLQGQSPEQLIYTVLQLQSQHHQYVAHISSQYQNISQQLAELRSSLHAFYSGQAACHQAAASVVSPSSALTTSTLRDPFSSSRQTTAPPLASQPPPTAPQPGPLAGLYHHPPSTSHSRSGSLRVPPVSPTTEAGVLPRPSAQTPATPGGPPTYEYRTVATVEEVWREYKEGIDGQPAIEDLDASWGSRWRPEPRGRTWYSRRKVIWDKIKEYISDGMDETAAVREVERLRDGGTINKLIRLLQDERKDRGLDDSLIG